MPTINLGQLKPRDVTYNKRIYQYIYQDSRWLALRQTKFANNPLCEWCEKRGLVVQTECIHHIVPFDIEGSKEQVIMLAFDYYNLASLCHECHAIAHGVLRR